MAGTIGPAVRETRNYLLLFWFALASVLAASALGGLYGFLGDQLRFGSERWRDGVLGGLALTALAVETGTIEVRSFGAARQVPRVWWHRYPKAIVSLGWGAQLGSGITTRISSVGFWLLVAAALVFGSPWHGAILVGCFGVVRGLGPLLAALSPLATPQQFTNLSSALLGKPVAIGLRLAYFVILISSLTSLLGGINV